MNLTEEQEIKKEFQLERVILFSDAVFAIIITIMVIDMKLPETIKEASNDIITTAFQNMWLKFTGYAISFSLVAMFWIRHLKIFSYVKDYNRNLLVLNLFSLFCVSLFPFAISLITGAVKPNSPAFMWGFNIYMCLLLATTFAQTVLAFYLIRNKATLCFASDVIMYELKWKILIWNLIVIPIILALIAVFNYFNLEFKYSFIALLLYGVGTSRLSKKYYPENDDEVPILFRLLGQIKKKSRIAEVPPGEEES